MNILRGIASRRFLLRGLALAFLSVLSAPASAAARSRPAREQVRPGRDPHFRPGVVRADFVSRRVRPGDPACVTFVFRNAGTAPGRARYRVFVHFEHPKAACSDIRFQYDHPPAIPTTLWRPNRTVRDGPYTIPVPAGAAPGRYHVHVGVYKPGPDGFRLCEKYLGTLEISPDAPSVQTLRPPPLDPAELARRRARLAHRLRTPQTVETPEYRFALDGAAGAFELLDKRAGVLWTSDPTRQTLGSVDVAGPEGECTLELDHFDSIQSAPAGLRAQKRLDLPNGAHTGITLVLEITRLTEPPGLAFRFSQRRAPESRWTVRAITFPDHAFGVTDSDGGGIVVPEGMGEWFDAREGLPGVRRYATYNGDTSMAMCGAVKHGAALFLAWPHPGVRFEVDTAWPHDPRVPGQTRRSLTLTLDEGARRFVLCPLGPGNYVTIGTAYRKIARKFGWLETFEEKQRRFPTVPAMFGAADFKPFVFTRIVPGSRFNHTGRDITRLIYTFDEAAAVAEHLHRDLGIDKAMYVLAGWIHRGYDNQHPDILPACPECGGNPKLAECARRVKACGFLFGLHDNYQDMYRDAPSWNLKYLNKRADGTPKKGGNWAGGQAWQVCAVEQVALASRPQNLPAVRKLFAPTVYFIDTTFAWPLVACEDPNHPMTRLDDMHWKARLCDLAKQYFGLFGSEKGREWAIPHADYFEGLLSWKTRTEHTGRGYDRRRGARVIPLFELAYGDCINLYTHQGDRAVPGRAKYILDCILYAENPVYGFGPHLYYKDESSGILPLSVTVTDFRQTGPRRFSASYRWSVRGKVRGQYRCFVHFTHPRGDPRREHIVFQDDHDLPAGGPAAWAPGSMVADGPRTVEIPPGIEGRISWLIGLSDRRGRALIEGRGDGRRRFRLGTLIVRRGRIRFEPVATGPAASSAVFARADHGWAAALGATDRFIKNTYEVTSWLNRITARTPMTEHRFCRADASVEFSAFGPVRVWVNYGAAPYTVAPFPALDAVAGGPVVLPRYGFLVLAPQFLAFHALRFGKTRFANSALFTCRSLDSRPLPRSRRVRVFHAFGPSEFRLAGQRLNVARERIVRLRGPR